MSENRAENEVTALAQQVEAARGKISLQHDSALYTALSDAEIAAERDLAEWIRAQRRKQRKQAVSDELAADRRDRLVGAALRRADEADARWHRKALAARRRVSSADARVAQLYRRSEWSSRALIGVVVLGMVWAGVNVQHNLVPSGDMRDPLYWLSFGIEAMISIPIIVIMITATTAARWGRELDRGKVFFFEAALLGTTVALNTGPHLASGDLGRAAEFAIAPVMVGVVIWLHAWVSARYALLIDAAMVELPADRGVVAEVGSPLRRVSAEVGPERDGFVPIGAGFSDDTGHERIATPADAPEPTAAARAPEPAPATSAAATPAGQADPLGTAPADADRTGHAPQDRRTDARWDEPARTDDAGRDGAATGLARPEPAVRTGTPADRGSLPPDALPGHAHIAAAQAPSSDAPRVDTAASPIEPTHAAGDASTVDVPHLEASAAAGSASASASASDNRPSAEIPTRDLPTIEQSMATHIGESGASVAEPSRTDEAPSDEAAAHSASAERHRAAVAPSGPTADPAPADPSRADHAPRNGAATDHSSVEPTRTGRVPATPAESTPAGGPSADSAPVYPTLTSGVTGEERAANAGTAQPTRVGTAASVASAADPAPAEQVRARKGAGDEAVTHYTSAGTVRPGDAAAADPAPAVPTRTLGARGEETATQPVSAEPSHAGHTPGDVSVSAPVAPTPTDGTQSSRPAAAPATAAPKRTDAAPSDAPATGSAPAEPTRTSGAPGDEPAAHDASADPRRTDDEMARAATRTARQTPGYQPATETLVARDQVATRTGDDAAAREDAEPAALRPVAPTAEPAAHETVSQGRIARGIVPTPAPGTIELVHKAAQAHRRDTAHRAHAEPAPALRRIPVLTPAHVTDDEPVGAEPVPEATAHAGTAARDHNGDTSSAPEQTPAPTPTADEPSTVADPAPEQLAFPTEPEPDTRAEDVPPTADPDPAAVAEEDAVDEEDDEDFAAAEFDEEDEVRALARQIIATRNPLRLTLDQVEQILELTNESWPAPSIGAEVGVSGRTVANVIELAQRMTRPYAYTG
ncbi:hypothetical protein ACWEVD_14405 [Nocardia thailandica]